MSATPEPLALLERAAELRAAGTPWADAAAQLAVDHRELRRLVAETCDFHARIAIDPRMESLNVSVATGIALHLLSRKQARDVATP